MIPRLQELARRFPALEPLSDTVGELSARVRGPAHEPFFEPKSLLEFSEGKPKLTAVDVQDVNAWRQHAADSASVRMVGLEDAIIDELLHDRLTAAMVVSRAHMEVAGLAAYCLERLFGAAKSGDWEGLLPLVQKTYFGTSMRIQAGGTPALEALILEEEGYPLKPGDLVKALDRYAAGDGSVGTYYQVTYGFLSEFAHPVMRGNRAFSEVVSSTPDGWYIRYRTEEPVDEGSAKMALEILVASMRVGHSCAALLDCSSFVARRRSWRFEGPSETEVHRIWTDLLQRELPQAGYS